jgi:hypothetical protein
VAQAVRREIEAFAEQSFAVARDEILEAQSKKTNRVVGRARLSGNSGGYLPALIESNRALIRKLVLAWARVYADAFTLYGLPTDTELDKKFENFGQQTAAGAISAIRGQFRLRSMRLRRPEDGGGVPWRLEIERAMESAVKKGLVLLNRQRVELRKRSDFSQRVSKDDPNYELAQRFYLGAWAHSHRLVADTLAGQVSFSEWVESCIKTFAQGAETQVAFVNNESIEEKCHELDRAADAFIHLFSEKVRATFKGQAKAVGESAIEHLTRSVRGIAARSKQQLFERAMDERRVAKTAAEGSDQQDAEQANARSCSIDKGNLNILRGPGGELKRAVTLEIARRFGGVTRRAIHDAAMKGSLTTEGKRQQRRVLVASLLEYFPPENNAK